MSPQGSSQGKAGWVAELQRRIVGGPGFDEIWAGWLAEQSGRRVNLPRLFGRERDGLRGGSGEACRPINIVRDRADSERLRLGDATRGIVCRTGCGGSHHRRSGLPPRSSPQGRAVHGGTGDAVAAGAGV